MNLYLLRHGIAVERGEPGFKTDADRPLTPKGKLQLRQIAAAMKNLEVHVDLMVSSPFLRARQTAEIVARGLGLKERLAFSDALTPDGDPKALIQQLDERKPPPENILLVGHEPYLSGLAALLISGKTTATMDLKKGGLCRLETDLLHFGHCATLTWLLTPKQMKWMS